MPLFRVSAIFVAIAVTASAQPPQGGPAVAAGHIHLNSSDPDAAIAFWKDVIGASTLSMDSMTGVGMSGATILFTKKAPAGPSAGSAIDHLAVRVADLQPFVDNLAKTTYKSSHPDGDKGRIVIQGPDGVTIEMIEESAMYTSLEFSHIHLHSANAKEMQAWYVKNFGGRAGAADAADSVQIPGAMLTFTQADTAVGTLDRAVDHLGFEVKDVAAICAKLGADGAKIVSPPHAEPRIKGTVALVTDPWGTRFELIQRGQ